MNAPRITITSEQAAKLLGLSRKEVRRLCNLGRLPGVRDGKRWKLYLPALLAAVGDQAAHPQLPRKGTAGGRPRHRLTPPSKEALHELIATLR